MKKAKFQFVDENRGRWSVSAMCRVLKVTRQGYYQWASRPISAHDERDLEIAGVMIPLWEELNSCYGAPKMLVELRRAGVRTSKKRVARLMSEYGMAGTCGVGLRKPGAPKGKPETDDADDLARVVKAALADREALAAMGQRARDTIPIPWTQLVDNVLERYRALVK